MSGAKRSPEFLLKVTFTILVLWTWNWIKVGRTCPFPTLYTSRKPLQHLLATGVPSCEESRSAHEQNCKISREELPHPVHSSNSSVYQGLSKHQKISSTPVRKVIFLLCGDFTPFISKNVQIWDHFFPVLFPKDSENSKSLDIVLWEVGAKRCLNGMNKL